MQKQSTIIYQNKGYSWGISFTDKKIETDFEFKEIFKGNLTREYNSIFSTDKVSDNYDKLFSNLKLLLRNKNKPYGLDKDSISNLELILNELNTSEKYPRGILLLNRALLILYKHVEKKMEFQSSIYFPTERNIVSLVSDSLGGLYANNVALPDAFKRFFSEFEVSRKEIGRLDIKDFNVLYTYKEGNNIVSSNNYEISLDVASSGLQSIIPLYVVIENITQDKNPFKNNLIIEEPELNLHPIKQKVLTEYVVSKINKTGNNVVITSHSPYLLTVLDNLLLAKNVNDNKPKKNKSTKNIIPEKYWIDYENISVYQINNDGTVESIKNDEFKSLNVNTIDEVSDIISDNFDMLTDFLYVED